MAAVERIRFKFQVLEMEAISNYIWMFIQEHGLNEDVIWK